MRRKIIIYQILVRVFGNKNSLNKSWASISENGVGKFCDIDNIALGELKKMGVTHLWFTGVLHHSTTTDYSSIGIESDLPEIVKGKAGSPYAIKDYFNVDPDLAVNQKNRLEEFKQLVDRAHKNGFKVIIDIVPNHIARSYKSISKPVNISDFGANDNNNIVYDKNNNFYYILNEKFISPTAVKFGNRYYEYPARYTGDGNRSSTPSIFEWYETVKLNFGISPEGLTDFPLLDNSFRNKDYNEHFNFWKDKELPDTWLKFRQIVDYWIDFGIDGFRYDMAELVPVEFWSFLNSHIKIRNNDFFLLAEVYNNLLYRDYILIGKMDFLYNKVDLYDTLKAILKHNISTDTIISAVEAVNDINDQMVSFLENHDEERLAHEVFTGDPFKALPAFVVSATINSAPFMIYFGQEVGEKADDNAGFGSPSRTSIFDYIGAKAHQRWMNNGLFDGGKLSETELKLRSYYLKVLNFITNSGAVTSNYLQIHSANRAFTQWYNDKLFSFVRWSNDEKIIVVVNFCNVNTYGFELLLPVEIVDLWNFENNFYNFQDVLEGNKSVMKIAEKSGRMRVDIKPLQSLIFKLIAN